MHEIRVDRDRRAGDREVLERPQRVDAVVGVGGYVPIAEKIVLDPHGLRHAAILALSWKSMSDDLDFSQPAGAPKPPADSKPPAKPAAAPGAPLYIPAVARSFFESAGKEEE